MNLRLLNRVNDRIDRQIRGLTLTKKVDTVSLSVFSTS